MLRLTSLVVSTASLASLAAGAECNTTVSDPIVATIDNSTYFDTCALEEEGVTFNVNSLFDVLNFTSADFLLFCNSSTCLEPVHEMLHSIPTDCLISYDGSDRNLSEEVTSLHTKCHEVLGEDDDDDGDDDEDGNMSGMDMSGMDMSGMDMSGMDMGSAASSSSSTNGASKIVTASTLAMVLAALVLSADMMV